jgi:GNAT superfamily N-acetyltransferase
MMGPHGTMTCGFVADNLQEFANPHASMRAVLEHVRVDEQHRRRGYGRVLVAAALALVPDDYSWSTTAINRTIVAKAFWATVGLPGPATSAYCSHMRAASNASR